MSDIDNNKPCSSTINYTVTFYEEDPKPNTFGSNNISYKIVWYSANGIMQIIEIGAFGDGTVVGQYQDRRGRGITLDEMLENIKEISNMTYKEFKEKVLMKGK